MSAKRADIQPKSSAKKATGRPFEKTKDGKRDPRINTHGRPKTHDELRKLIQRIAGEALADKPEWTRIEAMVRAMIVSKSPVDRIQVIEHGWGKVPQQLDINVKDVDNAIESELARLAGTSQVEDAGAAEGQADSGEAAGPDQAA